MPDEADTAPAPAGKVLLVEDDALLSGMIAMGLRRERITVETAADGEEGLARARAIRPDVILSDWMMPRRDGLWLCREAKADPDLRGAVFILLTAKHTVPERVAGLEAGADEFLSKPVQMAELAARVRAALRLRALQGELATRAKELEELNRLKDQFLGMAAHDLRSPLGTVRMWLEAMGDGMYGPLAEAQARAVQTVDRQVVGMLDLVNDLLDITRIHAGKVRWEPRRVDVAPILADLREQYEPGARRKDLALSLEAGPAATVQADPARLAEAVGNLLQNAIKYTAPGGRVAIGHRVAPGGVEIFVKDTGVGIPPGEQSRLFEAFARLTPRPTGGERSTGLGLAIVKKLVDLHGGEILVDSRPGEGSTFTVRLPAAPPEGG